MAAAYAYHLAESQEGQLFDAMIGIAEHRVSKVQLAQVLKRLAVPYVED